MQVRRKTSVTGEVCEKLTVTDLEQFFVLVPLDVDALFLASVGHSSYHVTHWTVVGGVIAGTHVILAIFPEVTPVQYAVTFAKDRGITDPLAHFHRRVAQA